MVCYLLLSCFNFTLLPQQFYEEVINIQRRHAALFPAIQLTLIQAVCTNGKWSLHFREGYNLSSAITMEIELTFKILFHQFNAVI